MDLDYHPITLCLQCSQSPPKALNDLISREINSFFELYCVLRTLSVLWTLGFAPLCEHNSPQSATRLEQNTARLDNEYTCGRLNRLTAHYFGYELLAIGYWLWAMGWGCGFADICASTLYALRFTLKATATTPLTFRLIAL